jgi:hypothetical protein
MHILVWLMLNWFLILCILYSKGWHRCENSSFQHFLLLELKMICLCATSD